MTVERALSLSEGDLVHAGHPDYHQFRVIRVNPLRRTPLGTFVIIEVISDKYAGYAGTERNQILSYSNSCLEPGPGPGPFRREE